MSILKKNFQRPSITEGWRALELFTDRYEAVRLFCSHINDDPSEEKIIFFTGEGGIGKSLLLKFLNLKCCKRLSKESWESTKNLNDEEFTKAILNVEGKRVKSAYIDFALPPCGEERPQEAFSALLSIRRQLSNKNLKFPLFDFGCIWYLHKTRKLSKDKLQNLFPAEETDFISLLADSVSGSTWGAIAKTVLSLFNKHLQEGFTIYSKRRKLTEDQLKGIQRLEAESELLDKLPELFAADINLGTTQKNEFDRIALFFDTHEAFWGHERMLPTTLYYQRDEWLRNLIGNLELSDGIVVIVAGRDKPRWNSATKYAISENYINIFPLKNFTNEDAETYLGRAGVQHQPLKNIIIKFTSVEPNKIQPFYLGLCADLARISNSRGDKSNLDNLLVEKTINEEGRALVDRLLKYVDAETSYAVRALCACRSFDYEIFQTLGESLSFACTEPVFNALITFSFVIRQEDGRFRTNLGQRAIVSNIAYC